MNANEDDGPPLFGIDYSDESHDERLQAASIAIEKAIERGNVELAQVLRIVVQVQSTIANEAIYQEDDGGYDGEKLLSLIRYLAEGVRLLAQNTPRRAVAAPASADDFERRSRALCADLMSLEIDGNIHHHADYLRDLQCEARSLLTGEALDTLLKSVKEDA